MEEKNVLINKVEFLELKVKLYELRETVQTLNEKVLYLENMVLNLEQMVKRHESGQNELSVVGEDYISPNDMVHDTKTKDKTKYLFEGVEYSKSRLVLAVVTKYAIENKQITGQELIDTFPASKIPLGSWTCIKYLKDIPAKYQSNPPRYFCKNQETIKLSNGDVLATCTQWTKDSIDKFIKYVRDELGYKIEEISK